MYFSQKLIIVVHCSLCMPVNKTSSPSNSVAQTAEHIAAQSGGFPSNARAAAAVDAVFTRVTDGNFRLMKSRHWPRAYNNSGCVWLIHTEETHLFVAQDSSDITMLHAFSGQQTMLYSESNLASDKSCIWNFQKVISLDNTSKDGVLLRYNPYRNLQTQCLEYVYKN